MPSRILFLGRQPDQYAPLWRQLSTSQAEVFFAASLSRGLRTLGQTSVDVIILDATTLRASPQQMARTLRRTAPSARLILLSERPLTGGLCHDYQLSMPVSWRELLHTIHEALASEHRQVLAIGPFVLDLDEQIVVGPNGESRLTPKQFRLLELLMRHPNQIVARQTIMQQVWNTNFLDDTRTLDVHICWLRREIEPNPRRPQYLITKRGAGYMFCPDGQSSQARSSVLPGR